MGFFRQLLKDVVRGNLFQLPKGRLFRAAALLSGSTLLVQIVALCLAPVYARLYTPSDYGVFGQFYSVVTTLLIVGCFCYELAIPAATDDEEAVALLVLSTASVGVVTLISSVWAALHVWRSSHGAASAQRFYFLLVPLGVLLSGMYRIVQYWAVRVRALKAIAGTSVNQMLGGQAINLGLGLVHPSPLGLILGQIVSSSAGTGSLTYATGLFGVLKRHRGTVFRARRLREVAIKHRQYALMQCPSTLLNSLGLYLPGMLMLPYFGAEFAGQFNLAQRLGRVPIGLVGSSLSQVFFSEAASVARNDPRKLRPLFHSVSRKLALASLLVLLVCLSSPWAVPIAFGPRWHQAGWLAMLLAFGLAMQLWVSPLSNVPNVVGRLKGQFIIDATRAVLVFAALFIPYRFALPGEVSVGTYSAVLAANYVACYFLYRHQLIAHSPQSAAGASMESGALAT
jgi:O-antigen/teichoic acid export membrane protein